MVRKPASLLSASVVVTALTLIVEGPLVKAENTVTAHCTGWLADGTKF